MKLWLLIVLSLLLILPAAAQDTPVTGADDRVPSWSPDGTQLLFLSYRDGTGQIYVMDRDGANVRRVTKIPGRTMAEAEWSPDGQSILVHTARDADHPEFELYIVDVMTGASRLVDETGGGHWRGMWSPDGRYVSYKADMSLEGPIMVLDLTTGQRRQVSNDTTVSFFYHWSPDSSKIALYGKHVNDRNLPLLYLYDVSSGTLSPELFADITPDDCCAFLEFSLDSTQVAFQPENSTLLYFLDTTTFEVIREIDSEGTVGYGFWLDADTLLVALNWGGEEWDTSVGLYKVELSDGSIKKIKPFNGAVLYLSPDRTRLVILDPGLGQIFKPSKTTLYFVKIDGDWAELQLEVRGVYSFSWSPDSIYAAAALCEDGDFDIYWLDAVTGEATKLTEDDAFTGEPVQSDCPPA
jgi:Tol biopolymer transport system component